MEKKAKIFIIEDDPDALEVMKVTLQAKNYQIFSAQDPEKGFDKAKQTKPDLLILDVMFGKQEMAMGFDYAVKMKQDKDLADMFSGAIDEALRDGTVKKLAIKWFGFDASAPE